jgi:hypothetical protein
MRDAIDKRIRAVVPGDEGSIASACAYRVLASGILKTS